MKTCWSKPSSIVPASERNTSSTHDIQVRFNRTSIAVTFLFIMNLVSMPMKAYTTEEFPWQPYHNQLSAENHTDFSLYEHDFVYKCRQLYGHLNTTARFHHDEQYNSDLYQTIIEIPREGMATPLVYSIPGAIAFSDRAVKLINEFGFGQRNSSSVFFASIGYIFGVAMINTAVWISPQNYSLSNYTQNQDAVSETYTVYTLQEMPSYNSSWLFCKFFYRFFVSIYTIYRIWTSYCSHIRDLIHDLKQYGLKHDDFFNVDIRPDRIVKYVVIIGDPTSIVLLDPIISIAFIIDVWLSMDVVIQAMVRVSAMSDVMTFFIAALYLSRFVWYAYSGLYITSVLLKRLHLESYFREVDPTVIAIVVAFIAGPLTYTQMRIPIFFDMYKWLMSCAISTEATNKGSEGSLALTIFALLIAGIPVIYGFAAQYVQCSFYRKRGSISDLMSARYASFGYNDLKRKILLRLSNRYSNFSDNVCFAGGSVYHVFAWNKRYKYNPTMSQRDADCYVQCMNSSDKVIASIRLTLLQSIDMRHKDPTLVVEMVEQKELRCAVSRVHIVFDTKDQLDSNHCSHDYVQIQQGKSLSCWMS